METSLEGCAELFMNGDTPFGKYDHHLRATWQHREHPNLHIMFYEDMKADLNSQLSKLNCFLNLGLSNDDLVR